VLIRITGTTRDGHQFDRLVSVPPEQLRVGEMYVLKPEGETLRFASRTSLESPGSKTQTWALERPG
jgi:hypothetical protein